MALKMQHNAGSKALEVDLTGKLTKEDYERFSPRVEALLREHGKLDMLIVLEDFHGWSAGAIWEDIKFDLKHFNDIGKLAIVGENKWEKGMAIFCKPFTTASVRFFPHQEIAAARAFVGLSA